VSRPRAFDEDSGTNVSHAVVVLNYRTATRTIASVASLDHAGMPVDVVVVDNGSGDGSPAVLRRALPAARVVECPVNGGFSAGCNAGIREALRAGATRVFLLNSDAVVGTGALATLARAMDADPRLGVAGPTILAADRRRIESRGIRYSRVTARMRHLEAEQEVGSAGGDRLREVDAISGAAMLIRTEVFHAIGFLDESFFFGFEDLDFCLRARVAGFSVACVEEAVVVHEGNASIGRASASRIYFAVRNHLRVSDSAGGRRGRWMRRALVVGYAAAYALSRSEVPIAGAMRALTVAIRDFAAGRFGPAPDSVTGRR
jgi:GT2 family glycosyltransferase